MKKGNVLVIGNSGVGKSTLINAVLGDERAETNYGTVGTTERLSIYTSEKIAFRIIDTVGFEPAYLKARKAINAVKKWSKESLDEDNENGAINAIWFCVEGTSRKLFPKALKDLAKATSMWKSVPVIVVITKSYSIPERAQNIDLVNMAFEKEKKIKKRIRHIIPVVASTYVIDENSFVAPDGITNLTELTNDLMPEGIKAAKDDILQYKLARKRTMAHGINSAAVVSAAVIGAIPIPFADAAILGPLEIALINALGIIYEIGKDENSKLFKKSIVDVGTVSVVAKGTISVLKAIPGVNIGASVLNSFIAASIVAILGGGSIYVFEQVYLGNKEVTDLNWAVDFIGSKFSNNNINKIAEVIKENAEKITDPKAIGELVSLLFNKDNQ